MNEQTELSGSYVRPWTQRVFAALPGNHAAIGVSLFLVLLLVFLAVRVLLDGGVGSSAGDFRLALIHITLIAFSSTAYAYLLSTARTAARELQPLIGTSLAAQLDIERIGKHIWWGLVLAALAGMFIDVYATTTSTTGSDPWDWSQNNYDSLWMRVLGPMFTGWIGCIIYVLLVESARLSNLCKHISTIDVFDLTPFQPLIRQGLTHALLVVIMFSMLSLFLLEPGFVWLMVALLPLFAVVAWLGLMLPLRGIRRKISLAKEQERVWCREALKQARADLKSGAANRQSIAELAAYKGLIEDVHNLPFDSPTLGRFALYLLIPIGSMLGGAFVERGLDLFLN